MARYFLDTEFLEGPQKTWFGKTKPTIDLISIGIVCEDGREYYAISKDFNLKEAWNRYQIKDNLPESLAHGKIKEYWIRDNVLLPIYKEFVSGDVRNHIDFSYNGMKWILNKYGKSNEQIAKEIKNWVENIEYNALYAIHPKSFEHIDIEFYAYYADYDWVAFCWLFGKMIDLPKGFPMYCIDLKQIMDEKEHKIKSKSKTFVIKKHKDYPKQKNEHNALDDARWNLKLYKFFERL